MRVLAVVSECFPYVKTGGLADVASALPRALTGRGHDVAVLLPGYPSVLESVRSAAAVDVYAELYGGSARVLQVPGHARAPGLFVLDAPHLFDRPGHPYLGPDGRDWPDNPVRFAALAVVAREIGLGRLPSWRPDVVHAHDWQAGLVPAYLALDGRPRPATVMTVHNLAFQGQFASTWFGMLGLPSSAFAVDGVEYYGGVGFLKAGLYYADKLTTVSPTYARQIKTPEGGMGLDGLIAGRSGDLVGIANGIDTDHWNPACDPHLTDGYDTDQLEIRAGLKAAMQRELGLDEHAERPLFCVVSRLTWLKGMDVLLAALSTFVETGAQLAVLGSGDAALEEGFAEAARGLPGRIACRIGYDESRTHRLLAGSDAILVPSRVEPCGLTQLYGLRYGCIPVVARAGGLVDTVIDADDPEGTGILHDSGRVDCLVEAIQRTVSLYHGGRRWRELQGRGMALDLGWMQPARAYETVFEAARARRR